MAASEDTEEDSIALQFVLSGEKNALMPSGCDLIMTQ